MLMLAAALPAAAGDDAGDMPSRIAAGQKDRSYNWAGWAVQSGLQHPSERVVSRASGQWTVPAVTCTDEDAWSSVWVGIDGFDNGTVQQAGTAQACKGGQAQYFAFYQTYPNPLVMLPILVRPGDVVSAEIRYLGVLNLYALSLTNRTLTLNIALPVTLPEIARSQATRRSAEWVVEAPNTSDGRILPLADFGSVTFTDASVTLNGSQGDINSPAWENTDITMVNASGGTLAEAGPLNSAGDGFTVHWRTSR
jgi:hypothetical protein